MACGSSFSAGSVSSSAGSACSISAGRVTMATPSFGTYYLATAVTGIAVPAAQVVAAAPASVNIPASSVDSIDSRPSDGYMQPQHHRRTAHSHYVQRHCRHFFRRLRRRAPHLRPRVRAAIACSIPVPRMTRSLQFLDLKAERSRPPRPEARRQRRHCARSLVEAAVARDAVSSSRARRIGSVRSPSACARAPRDAFLRRCGRGPAQPCVCPQPSSRHRALRFRRQ